MNTTDTTNKQVFTTGEAAELCNVSQQTIIRCFDQGRLDGFRVPGSRFRRIPRASLLKFMQDNGIPAVALEVNRCNVLVISDDLSHVDALCSTVNDQKVSVHPVCTAWDAGASYAGCDPEFVLQFSELPGLSFEETESLIDASNHHGAELIRCTSDSNWHELFIDLIRELVGADGIENTGDADRASTYSTIS